MGGGEEEEEEEERKKEERKMLHFSSIYLLRAFQRDAGHFFSPAASSPASPSAARSFSC